MYTEGAPDFVFDQGMYYPAAASYTYYCTGFESPGEWENHQMFFGADGSVGQHAGGQTENSPYLCYTPNYGYAQSLYNPYNPYIPGAVNGAEGPFLGHQYHSIPTYQDDGSAPAYGPHVQPDISSNSSSDHFFDGGVPIASRSDARRSKPKSASATAIHSRNPPKPAATYQGNSLGRIPERPRTNTGQNKQTQAHGSVSSAGFSVPTSTHAVQGKTASVSHQPFDNMSTCKLVRRGQFEVTSFAGYLSDFRSNGYAPVHKLQPETFGSRGPNDINASESAVAEQNRGPRTKNWKNQLVVKAYTTKAGALDPQGDIIIHPNEYNKDDFNVDYNDAKFFVIKSYSEDDLHKSIKYNVWSSTPHGNKKLQNAYEDAQKAASENSHGCPIFLYFSVNASGMFCGVAEMVGPVDFHKDKDFWQQDKWSGSFPVNWHIIKDVPNSYFRHIILENNENKPVTNSRDTQVIMPMQGLEMLKIFKDYKEKTSLLDDFMYYENRQRIMHEDKTRLLNANNFQSPFLTPKLSSTYKPYVLVKPPFVKDEKISKDGSGNALISQETESYLTSVGKDASSIKKEETVQVSDEAKEDISSTLRIDSLAIDQSGSECKPVLNDPDSDATVLDANQNKGQPKQISASVLATNQEEAVAKPVSASSVVTVGSMPIKVDGSIVPSSQILTVGSIPLDPRSLKQ